jgi:hypothetical protein
MILICHAVPDPIVKPVAWMHVAMFAGHKMAEDMGAFVVGEAEVTVKRLARGWRHLVFRDQSSPGEIAGISRPHARPELLTHSESPPSAPIRRSPDSRVPSSNCAATVPARRS